jgi:hypothetical protein
MVNEPRAIIDGFINVSHLINSPGQVPISLVGIRIAEIPKTKAIIERLSKPLFRFIKTMEIPTAASGAPSAISALADCWQVIAAARSEVFLQSVKLGIIAIAKARTASVIPRNLFINYSAITFNNIPVFPSEYIRITDGEPVALKMT